MILREYLQKLHLFVIPFFQLLIFLAIAFLITIISFITFYKKVFPKTYLADYDISGMTKNDTEIYLNTVLNQPIKLKIKDRIYTLALSDIGISIDQTELLSKIFERNNLPIHQKLLAYFKTYRNSINYSIPTIFSNQFDEFIQSSVFDLTQERDGIELDDITGKFDFKHLEERYTIDPITFRNQLEKNIGVSQYIFKPNLARAPSTRVVEVSQLNKKLAVLYQSPLEISIYDGISTTSLVIDEKTLKSVSKTIYDSNLEKVTFSLNENVFNSLVLPKLYSLKLPNDMKIAPGDIKNALITALTDGFESGNIKPITITATLGPNTLGDKAYKYIEIDISQQRMYLFENSTQTASYRVSTGKYLPTPTGEFSIINKASSGAYSDIWHVFMPYWMAFYYNKAYYGIHELPYYYSRDGTKITRPREFIGSPNTGGCVALDIGDAEKVFAFGEVDMPVLIYD